MINFSLVLNGNVIFKHECVEKGGLGQIFEREGGGVIEKKSPQCLEPTSSDFWELLCEFHG